MALSSKRKSSSSASNASKPTFRRASTAGSSKARAKASSPSSRPASRASKQPVSKRSGSAGGGFARGASAPRMGAGGKGGVARPRAQAGSPSAAPRARAAGKQKVSVKPQAAARQAGASRLAPKPAVNASSRSAAGRKPLRQPAAASPASRSKLGASGASRLKPSPKPSGAAKRGAVRASGGAGEGRAGLASALSRIKLPAIAIPGRIVAVVAAVLLVLVVGGVVVTNSPIFSVTEVVVNGSEHVTQNTVERLVDVPEGSTLFNYDASAIEASLKQNPWVESVQIERTFPHTITITPVEYKVAAIAYITSSDVAWAIDASGTWIAPISLSVTVDAEGNVVSSTAGTQASLQQGGDGSADASASSDGAGGDAASSDSTGGDASSSGDGADASGASSDSDAAGDAEGGSSTDSDTAPTDGGSGSDAASADNASSSDGSAADGTQALTGLNAALALARQDGAVLFTDIASDVEPSEGSKVSSDVITAGLEYVSGFSSDFLAQIDYLSLESVDAISVFLSNGIEVALGEPADVSLKERVVTGLLDQVQGITYVDVRNPERPTYRSAPSA